MFTAATIEHAHAAVLSRPMNPAWLKMAEEILADAGDIYERDMYCFSNFAAFKVFWRGIYFDTAEHAYHWEKFNREAFNLDAGVRKRCELIRKDLEENCMSAHAAFELAQLNKDMQRPDWNNNVGMRRRPIKVLVMGNILRAKLHMHPYLHKKAAQVVAKGIKLTERSWRDDFWGTGPDENGADWMGVLWMETIADWMKEKVG